MLGVWISLERKETPMKRSGPQRDTQAPAKWEEVWWWGNEIEKRWGYSVMVSIFPPLPSKKDVRYVVSVEATKMSVKDNQKDTKMRRWRSVQQKGLTAETVALQLLVDWHRQLDNEELERERAAEAAGAMF
jgi:hypothetical protein